jgi:hypothetical protein
MTKSATDVMQDVIYAAVVDAIVALKASSRGVPNTLLRDLNAVHANTTFADLPEALQASIPASVRAAFTRLLKEGYSVSPGRPAPPARPEGPRRGEPPRRGPEGAQRRADGPRRGPRPGGRPGGTGGPSGKGPGAPGGRPGGSRGSPGGKPGPRKG